MNPKQKELIDDLASEVRQRLLRWSAVGFVRDETDPDFAFGAGDVRWGVVEKWAAAMIDIETLATTDDAVILEIGVVMFDQERQRMGPCESWQLDSNLQEDRKIDAETVRWWLDPERAGIFAELTGAGARPELWHGLQELSAFLGRHLAEGGEVWAKGNFDLRILQHAYKSCEMEVPWGHRQARELRTVLKWMRVPTDKKAPAHRAEDDAKLQVQQLFDAVTRLPLGKEFCFKSGWMIYRSELATTRAHLLPVWEDLPAEVKEAWCAGVRAARELPTLGSEDGRLEPVPLLMELRRRGEL